MNMKGRRNFLIKGSWLSAGLLISGNINPLIKQSMAFTGDNQGLSGGGFQPSYLKLAETGELKERWQKLWPRMAKCDLCPRECEKNRLRGIKGTCGADAEVKIASFHPHFGEENELVGKNGSGTIFLSNCAMRCVFCINSDISQGRAGKNYPLEDFAEMMLAVQIMGCHNLNLVTPTQYLPHILRALEIAAKKGLNIPIVYNTHGWEKPEMLKMLDGVVDIYLPDFKYAEPDMGAIYSAGATSYPEITQQALLEMNRQVGVALPDPETGLMHRGLMIRHLVMPNHIENSKKVVQWIAGNLPKNTYVNLMSQYSPYHRAKRYPEIARSITTEEYGEVIAEAQNSGLTNFKRQRI